MTHNDISIDYLIKKFGLRSHPEGGYFRESYRAQGVIKERGRNYSTAIYFLLPKGTKSRLHRIKSDEVFHFYLGGPLNIVLINKKGRVEEIILGQNIRAGHLLQYVVPAGLWFGAYPAKGTKFSFVSCTVAPSFDFADFEIGKKQTLLKQYPHARKMIEFLAA